MPRAPLGQNAHKLLRPNEAGVNRLANNPCKIIHLRKNKIAAIHDGMLAYNLYFSIVGKVNSVALVVAPM